MPGKKTAKRPSLRTQDLLPILDVDLSKGPGNVILPFDLEAEKKQAKHLGWYVAEVRAANRNLKLGHSLPMICAATGCYWAGQCETAPDFLWEGLRCPIEMMDIYKHWIGYVRELEVGPSDFVDVKMVEDLVRIELQLIRIDRQIQIQGMLVDTVGGVIQNVGKDKGGVAVYEKSVHPLLTLQNKLRKDRNEIYDKLEVSREAKRKARQSEGKMNTDLLSIMSAIKKQGARIEEIVDVDPLPEGARALMPGEDDGE